MAQNIDEQDDDSVSVAADPDEPQGVVDLSGDGDEMSPEDVYKQILNMRDEAPADSEAAANPGAGESPAEAGESGATVPDAQYQDINEKYLRALADLDNLRKRQQRSQIEMRKYGHESAIRELLPVLDNLERAIGAADDHAEGELAKFVEGTQMIVQQFIGALSRLGIERIEAAGETFDPQIHEAMQEIESAEHPAKTVVYQMEPGYQLYDRLLRPAKVVVSKGAPPSETQAAGEPDTPEANGGNDNDE